MKQEMRWLFYDIMETIWVKYHKWILHNGFKYNAFSSCNHKCPFNVLTPRKFRSKVKIMLNEYLG